MIKASSDDFRVCEGGPEKESVPFPPERETVSIESKDNLTKGEKRDKERRKG